MVEHSTRPGTPHSGPKRVRDMAGDDAARTVAVLLSSASRRMRLVDALHHAGYQVVIPRDPVAWATAARSPVLVVDDSAGAARLRSGIAAQAPGTPCVVLLAEPTVAQYREALAAGATALPASSADHDVVAAVGAAAREFTYLPATAARILAGYDGDRPVITDREAGWLRALVDGTTVASLARTVGYSEREMYRVLGNLYERLGADNRTEALLRADRWGLLAPGEAGRRPHVPGQRRPARC